MALTVEELIERDGPACVWCGRELWRRDLTLEHVIPRSRGGHLVAENAVVACRSCNRRRGSCGGSPRCDRRHGIRGVRDGPR